MSGYPGPMNFQLPISLLLVVVLSTACKDPATHSPAQPESITDTAYQFRLNKPGPGWRLLDAEQAGEALASTGARAGAAHTEGLVGLVSVEPDSLIGLEEMADRIASRVELSAGRYGTKKPPLIEKLTFQAEPAVRLSWKEGLVDRWLILFEHQGLIFHLAVYRDLHKIGQHLSSSHESFFDAFELLPGKVNPDLTRREESDRLGLGWWVRAGVYENVLAGLRVDPRGRWRLVLGRTLQNLLPGATVGLASPEATVLIKVAAGGPLPAVPKEGSLSFEVDGQPVFLYPLEADGREFLLGGIQGSGRQFVVTVDSPAVLAERVQADLKDAFASIDLLDAGAADSISVDLLSAPDPQSAFERHVSLIHGVVRDFENDFTWTKPKGFWRILVGDQAKALDSRAVLVATELLSGIRARLCVERSRGLSAEDWMRMRLGIESAVLPVSMGDLSGVRTPDQGAGFIAVAIRGKQALVFQVSGSHAADANAALRGLHLAAESQMALDIAQDGTFSDRRLGFSFLPPEGLSQAGSGLNPGAVLRSDRDGIYHWEGEAGRVTIEVLIDEEVEGGVGWVEISQHHMLGKNTLSQAGAKLSEEEFAGATWEHRSWRMASVEAFLTRRGRAIYVFIVSGAIGGDGLENIRAGFSFLD